MMCYAIFCVTGIEISIRYRCVAHLNANTKISRATSSYSIPFYLGTWLIKSAIEPDAAALCKSDRHRLLFATVTSTVARFKTV